MRPGNLQETQVVSVHSGCCNRILCTGAYTTETYVSLFWPVWFLVRAVLLLSDTRGGVQRSRQGWQRGPISQHTFWENPGKGRMDKDAILVLSSQHSFIPVNSSLTSLLIADRPYVAGTKNTVSKPR